LRSQQGMGMSWMGLFCLSLILSIPFYYLMNKIYLSLQEMARR